MNQKWPTHNPSYPDHGSPAVVSRRAEVGAPQSGWQTWSADEAGRGRERAKKYRKVDRPKGNVRTVLYGMSSIVIVQYSNVQEA